MFQYRNIKLYIMFTLSQCWFKVVISCDREVRNTVYFNRKPDRVLFLERPHFFTIYFVTNLNICQHQNIVLHVLILLMRAGLFSKPTDITVQQIDMSLHSDTIYWLRTKNRFPLTKECCVLWEETSNITVWFVPDHRGPKQ